MNTQYNFIAVILILLFFANCSSSPEVEVPGDIAELENLAVFSEEESPLYDVQFEQQAVFGDTEDIFISSIAGIDVDSNGNLYLADRSEAVVHAYNSSGGYLFTIGRKGEGPGEFNAAYQPTLFNNELYVLDIQQQRVSVFNPDNGDFLRTHSLGSGSADVSGFPMSVDPLSNNRFLVYYNSMQREGEKFYRKLTPHILDTEGNTLESAFIDFKPGEMYMMQNENSIQVMSLPFMGDSKAALTRDEEIVWGFNDRIFLQYVSLDGEYIRSIYYSREKPPLDRREMLDNYEDTAMRNAISALDIPSTRQAFLDFIIDDENRIWISLTTESEEVNEWWVLAESGEKLAAFMRASNHRLENVKDDYAYFRETDEETGLQQIVKYRFRF